jgi:hypothetical protein
MDEWFVRPWQRIRGISIKNMYARELSYCTPPLQNYIRVYTIQYIKRVLYSKKVGDLIVEYLCEFEAESKKALARESRTPGVIV